MNKKWQVTITGKGDWNFNKDNFVGIKIKSDNYLNFDHYEDALEFINLINVSNGNTDNLVWAQYFISEFDVEHGKKYKEGEIYIPNNIVTEDVITHYNEQNEIEKSLCETPYYELSEGEEFLEVNKDKFE